MVHLLHHQSCSSIQTQGLNKPPRKDIGSLYSSPVLNAAGGVTGAWRESIHCSNIKIQTKKEIAKEQKPEWIEQDDQIY